jgi:diaminohydroxyphosphoribosylaminopyrimidine deaminase/5-amino-6-(5-phosphoribosylamino)uracil reductase
MTTPDAIGAVPERARELERIGAELEPLPTGELPGALARLADRQITSVVLEGGAAIHECAWKAGLVDAVHLYVAPVSLGPDGVPWLDVTTLSVASLADRGVMPLGPDVFMEGYVHGID